jgi:hypothetical protein
MLPGPSLHASPSVTAQETAPAKLTTLDGSVLEVAYGDAVSITSPANGAIATPVDLGETCGITVWTIDTVSSETPIPRALISLCALKFIVLQPVG